MPQTIFIIDGSLYDQDLTGVPLSRQLIAQIRGEHIVRYLQKPGVRLLKQYQITDLNFHGRLFGLKADEDENYLQLLKSYICASKLDDPDQNQEKELQRMACGQKSKYKIKQQSNKHPVQQLEYEILRKAKTNKAMLLAVFRLFRTVYSDPLANSMITTAVSDALVTSNNQFYDFQPSIFMISALTYVIQALSFKRLKWVGWPQDEIYLEPDFTNDYQIPESLKKLNGDVDLGGEEVSDISDGQQF